MIVVACSQQLITCQHSLRPEVSKFLAEFSWLYQQNCLGLCNVVCIAINNLLTLHSIQMWMYLTMNYPLTSTFIIIWSHLLEQQCRKQRCKRKRWKIFAMHLATGALSPLNISLNVVENLYTQISKWMPHSWIILKFSSNLEFSPEITWSTLLIKMGPCLMWWKSIQTIHNFVRVRLNDDDDDGDDSLLSCAFCFRLFISNKSK